MKRERDELVLQGHGIFLGLGLDCELVTSLGMIVTADFDGRAVRLSCLVSDNNAFV